MPTTNVVRSRAFDGSKFGKTTGCNFIIASLDNIERAIARTRRYQKSCVGQGYRWWASQLESQLEGFGLVKIGVIGEAFDPTIHEAVTMEESDGEIEVVADVLQTGYKFGDTSHKTRNGKK